MSMHTPGPWTVEEYGDEDAPALVIHRDSETRVCFMATPGSYGDPAKIAADASLIAAAPELLEALEAVESEIALEGHLQAIVANAIAKATKS